MYDVKLSTVYISSERINNLQSSLTKLTGSKEIVLGVYKGYPEVSFRVSLERFADFETLYELARKYKQESILVVNESGRGYLVYVDEPLDYLIPDEVNRLSISMDILHHLKTESIGYQSKSLCPPPKNTDYSKIDNTYITFN